MPLVLIDNYDSFTWNLWHYLAELGVEAKVVRNDAVTAKDVMAWRPRGIVLSPGPCDPDKAGICLELIEKAAGQVPVMGVCLGHQAIGQVFGGRVVRAPEPMHGKISPVHHTGQGLFSGLPNPFRATRYHSLLVARDSLPDCLEITAQTEDGLIMGLSHRTMPIHGVQFHPESIASEHGHDMFRNFLNIAGYTCNERAA
ncbi:aminodeoxychorismate/anthranilate synthase component II [Haematospirillum sp. H1815]|uniref:anthranilate synthase component II n=1 Tax=Haematospirillum sp. H1815 TaxID=2723108 RepID=UPI00143C4431|nr:aminodeoxychorismate/anthranilate synthase component II [Haematospirillum sp. H1815]NKD76542.1 aminodeoxychorismate/anthranilate synthase component II [Haematospirillum sp. H1815]